MKPDAACGFTAYFAGPWQKLLGAVEIPGMAGASWDRKAAYLLWVATDGGKGVSLLPPVSDLTTDKPDEPTSGGIFD